MSSSSTEKDEDHDIVVRRPAGRLVRWENPTFEVDRVSGPDGRGRIFLEELHTVDDPEISTTTNLKDGQLDISDIQLGSSIRHMSYRSWERWYFGQRKERESGIYIATAVTILHFLLYSYITMLCQTLNLWDSSVTGTITWIFVLNGLSYLIWLLYFGLYFKRNSLLKLFRYFVYCWSFVAIVVTLTMQIDSTFHQSTNPLRKAKIACDKERIVMGIWLTDVPYFTAWIAIIADILVGILPVLAKYYYLRSHAFQNKWLVSNIREVIIEYQDSDNNDVAVHGHMIEFGRYSLTKEIFRQRRFNIDTNKAITDNVSIVGEVNDNGYIHGFAYWREQTPHMESLMGFWRYGKPMGPYKSWIVDTTSSISSVVAGYARYDPVDQRMKAGMAYVEACVTGHWFVGYPKVHFLRAPDDIKSQTIGGQVMKFIKGLILNTDHPRSTLSEGEAEEPIAETTMTTSSEVMKDNALRLQVNWMMNRLSAADAMPSDRSAFKVTPTHEYDFMNIGQVELSRYSSAAFITETFNCTSELRYVLYVHGFNNTTYESAQVIGQLMAFANLPDNFKFIIFSWPSGQGILHGFQYAKDQSKNPEVQTSLYRLLCYLYHNGCENLSIISHSMGCGLVLKTLNWALDHHLFARVDELIGQSPSVGSPPMKLKSVTLIQPCVYINDYLEGHFPIIRMYCDLITMYGNAKDNALFWADVVSKEKKTLGRTGLLKCYYSVNATDMIDESLVLSKGDELCLKHDAVSSHRRWLDMDVIDTTPMDSNISGQRHTFFNINRSMVDDISDIIQFRKRAKYRRRLENRIGNVWCFRSAPSCVKGTW